MNGRSRCSWTAPTFNPTARENARVRPAFQNGVLVQNHFDLKGDVYSASPIQHTDRADQAAVARRSQPAILRILDRELKYAETGFRCVTGSFDHEQVAFDDWRMTLGRTIFTNSSSARR